MILVHFWLLRLIDFWNWPVAISECLIFCGFNHNLNFVLSWVGNTVSRSEGMARLAAFAYHNKHGRFQQIKPWIKPDFPGLSAKFWIEMHPKNSQNCAFCNRHFSNPLKFRQKEFDAFSSRKFFYIFFAQTSPHEFFIFFRVIFFFVKMTQQLMDDFAVFLSKLTSMRTMLRLMMPPISAIIDKTTENKKSLTRHGLSEAPPTHPMRPEKNRVKPRPTTT